MIRIAFLVFSCVATLLASQQLTSAAGGGTGVVYNVPPNSLAPLFNGIGYSIPDGVRVNVSASAPVASANFYVDGGELYYNTPGIGFPGPQGINASGGGYVEFTDGFSENLQVTAGGAAKVLGGVIPNARVNDGKLDILGVQEMWLDHLQGTVNLSGGRVQSLFLGDFANGSPTAPPAVLHQTGGVLGEFFFNVFSGGVANISGGAFGPKVSSGSIATVAAGGVVNLIVASMEVDGTPLSGLSPNVAVELTQRNVNVTGVLASGDPFAFRAVTDFEFGMLSIESGGKLMVTLAIPEPTTASLVGVLTVAAILDRRRRA